MVVKIRGGEGTKPTTKVDRSETLGEQSELSLYKSYN